jgi:hypothetical protein
VAADIALYEAKQPGRDRIELYSGQGGVPLTWVQRIRRAIETGGFVLHAQPVCPLREDPSAEPMFELLVRMRDDAGARSLADPGLVERVPELIERHGAPPSHITGTGFGSFVLVKHIPVDALKIDAEFVRDLARSEADRRIVGAIVQIARDAGMRTVAEGIDDAGALAIVRELGVDYAQGYHLGPPAPAPGREVAPGVWSWRLGVGGDPPRWRGRIASSSVHGRVLAIASGPNQARRAVATP